MLLRSRKKIPTRVGRRKTASVIFGYKDNVTVDEKSKIITQYPVTDASVPDSQQTKLLVEESDQGKPLYADRAYAGAPIAKALEKIGACLPAGR